MRSPLPQGASLLWTRLAVGLVAAAAAFLLARHPLARGMEARIYDLRVRWVAPHINPSPDIVIVAIDDESLERLAPELGRWPWPRSVYAELIGFCSASKTLVMDVVFPEADANHPDGDARFARAVRDHGGVVTAVYLDDQPRVPRLPAALRRSALPSAGVLPVALLEHASALVPFAALLEASAGVGFVNYLTDGDGVLRGYAAAARVGEEVYPSLALAAAMGYLDRPAEIVRDGRRGLLRLPPFAFPLDPLGRFLLRPPSRMYTTYRVADVLLAARSAGGESARPMSRAMFEGKAVLVGSLATGLQGDRQVTPLSSYTAGVHLSAIALDNLLHGRFFRLPPWPVDLVLIALLCLVPALLPLERPGVLVFACAGLALLYGVGVMSAARAGSLMLPVTAPLAGLVLTGGSLGVRRWRLERRQRKELERLETSKQRFTDMLVHDLKGQMTPVVLSLSLLREKLSPEDVKVHALLSRTNTAVNRMVSQINTLLDIRRMQEGRMRLEARPTSLAGVAGEVDKAFGELAARANLELVWATQEDLVVEADGDLLFRVLGNLVWNAVRHASPGSRVELGFARAEPGTVSLYVANRGEVIPPRRQEVLFQPFVTGAGDRRGTGTGLGLAFCRLAVEAHGGTVHMVSPCFDEGDGVKVVMTLPEKQGVTEGLPGRSA